MRIKCLAAAACFTVMTTSVLAQDVDTAASVPVDPFAGCGCVTSQPDEGAVATVVAVVGLVSQVTSQGRPPVSVGQSLTANAEVQTGLGASTEIAVSDGCRVRLGQNQRMLLSTPAGADGDICVRAENMNVQPVEGTQQSAGGDGNAVLALGAGGVVVGGILLVGLGEDSASP
ncbi:MAG: hypothetical protein NXH88_16690 [Hyphomonas sp.]|nr:hypothetical protein [Hyphomonas sp.]